MPCVCLDERNTTIVLFSNEEEKSVPTFDFQADTILSGAMHAVLINNAARDLHMLCSLLVEQRIRRKINDDNSVSVTPCDTYM